MSTPTIERPRPLFRSIQHEHEERLRSAALSYFVVSGLSEDDAQHAAELVGGLVWVLVAGHRVREGVQP